MVCCCSTVLLIGFLHFLIAALIFRLTTGKYKIKKRLNGKVYIVTGATAGVGKSTAYRLALNGATVYMFCRNPEKAERVRKDLVAKSFNSQIKTIRCDLADFASVKEAAQEFLKTGDRLDGLINNAGVMYLRGSKQVTKNGHEEQIQNNHLGHFLLTMLLIDKIKADKARVVNLSSIAALSHRNFGQTAKFHPRDLDFEKRPYNGGEAYGNSKLANILFTRELARRLYGTGVTVNCCHPGAVDTELLRRFPEVVRKYGVPAAAKLGFMKFEMSWQNQNPYLITGVHKPIILQTAEQGAMTSLYLATSDDVEHISGAYFADCAPGCPSLQALDDHLAAELWDESEKMVKEFM